MLRRFPVITLQVPAEIVSSFDDRVVAVVPMRRDAEWCCRWCFGRPMPGYDMCSRVQCIQALESVDWMHSTTWAGEGL